MADNTKEHEDGLDDCWDELSGANNGKQDPKKTGEVQDLFPLKVGANVFIRTITHYHVGRVAAIGRDWVLLENCSWIADTGRWHDALKSGFPEKAEIEPFPDAVYVSKGAIVDITKWRHKLPEKQQ